MFWYVSGYNLSKGMKKHEDIMRKAKRHTFKAGSKISINTDKNSGYIILSGDIRCDFNTKANQSLGLIALQAGECFGGLNTQSHESVALTVLKDTTIIELSFEELMFVAKASNDIELNFYKGLFRRKTVVAINPQTIVFKPPKVRVEEALKSLAVKIGERRRGSIAIRIRPTSERLARMTGLGRLHTILTIADLYNDHKVVPGAKTLSLLL